jgi:hypothetical protein
MKTTLMVGWMVALTVSAAVASPPPSPPMAALAPADAKALVEVRSAAALRESALGGRFWAALQDTQAAVDHRATEQYIEGQARLEKFLVRLGMTRQEAMRAYFGGPSALVVLGGPGARPPGVLMTRTTKDHADRLIAAAGGAETCRHRDVCIWEVRGDDRVNRAAYAGGVLFVTESEGDALERVLDVAVGGGASLQADSRFVAVTADLPPDWSVRAYAAETKPAGRPGAAAFYGGEGGRLHAEWRILSTAADLAATAPARLTGPAVLPASAVAAVGTAFHPEALWDLAKAKAAAEEDGPARLHRAEKMIRAWFPGESLEAILGAFGPEAALALVRPESSAAEGAPPGLVGLVRVRDGREDVAHSFRKGLEAKALLLAALADEKKPGIEVRNEAYGDTSVLVIEAPEALMKGVLGDLAKGSALTVAVHRGWLVVGTAPGAVKAVLGALAGGAAGAPADPLTRWGTLRPAGGADLLLRAAEQLAGREKLKEADRLVNLAELMDLVLHLTWRRTDGPDLIRGAADLQVVH